MKGSLVTTLSAMSLILAGYLPLHGQTSIEDWVSIGDQHYLNKELDPAILAYSEALKLIQNQASSISSADIQNKIGDSYIRKRDYTTAIDILHENLVVLDSLGLKAEAPRSECYKLLGQAHRWQLIGDKALEWHFKALKLRKSFFGEISEEVAESYMLIANTFRAVFYNNDSSIWYGQKAVAIREQFATKDVNLGMLYWLIADLKREQANYYEALIYAKESLNTFEEVGINLVRLTNTTRVLIGDIESSLGNYVRARQYYEDAIIARESEIGEESYFLAFYYLKLSETLRELNDHSGALNAANKSIAINHREVNASRDWLGDAFREKSMALLSLGQFDSAYQAAESSLQIRFSLFGSNHREVTEAFQTLGQCALQEKRYAESYEYYHKSLLSALSNTEGLELNELPEEGLIGADLLQLESILMKGYVLAEEENEGKLSLALDHFILAIQVFESNVFPMTMRHSQLFLTSRYRHIREKATELALALYENTSDIRYADIYTKLIGSSKSNLLTQEIERSDANSNQVVGHLVRKHRILQNIIRLRQFGSAGDDYDSTLVLNARELEALDSRLSKELQSPQQYLYTNSPGVANLQAHINSNEVFIDMAVFSEFIYSVSVTTDGFSLNRLHRSSEFESALASYRSWFDASPEFRRNKINIDTFTQSAFTLYQTLISTTIREYDQVEALHIIPDGDIAMIPFESLLTSLTKSTGFREQSYLVKKCQINYFPSSGLFLDSRKRIEPHHSNTVLAMSFSNLETLSSQNARPIPELPGTIQEIEGIGDHFTGDYFAGLQAQRLNLVENVKGKGILHLALHAGAFAPQNGEGYIVFRNDTERLDTLFAHELTTLPEVPQLVFLSACQTGVGEDQLGEGINSLAREFLALGAQEVISSLWNISDHQGVTIVSDFYNWLERTSNVNHSLRMAKLEYLKKSDDLFSDPVYWAGFVAYGDTELADGSVNTYFLVAGIGALLLLIGVPLRNRFFRPA